ncbi:PP2C family serine/threonine-protein phosphatase [Limnofasciculus baicalensis]|uniref:Zinc ribbon domain-containing protein n=1 Tax=Limnofasciculus baicalensis BBK-W-15 TaxID=2699891 RepID=A0AAE3GT49_9CYAN|nr:zinc-ribbon domain-containing protein [Limnofasciculus baicalensis]MCP2729413.1 zinc ribbon domain-containing protein [Limnofasciculus baicalensis BBK-W-15]
MECPNCGTIIQIGDRFCEECGTSLVAKNTTGGCAKCGAGAIDSEGYCSNCGFRSEVRESDYVEVNVNSSLAGVCDRGLKRHRNEDYLACAKIDGKNIYVLVVCDGVSSSQSPELAAKAAAEIACQSLTTGGVVDVAAMKDAIASALLSVCKIPYNNRSDDPPSTTIVAAIASLVVGASAPSLPKLTATIGWMGDSRAYWISPSTSRQLTADHSWLNDVVSSGKMTAAEAKLSPNAHAISRWVGADIPDDLEPSIIQFNSSESGCLLLCTDGLWNYAPQAEQIAALVQSTIDIDALGVSRRLVDFARGKGGNDNITVAVLSVA